MSFKEPQIKKMLHEKAVQLLAQRSYSSHSLKKKLIEFIKKHQQKKTIEESLEMIQPLIEDVISACERSHWLDDDDYICRYTKMKIDKGYGESRIVMELMRQGFPKTALLEQIERLDIQWYDVLTLCADKKLNGRSIDTLDDKEKQKIYRFLLSRGFSYTMVNDYFHHY